MGYERYTKFRRKIQPFRRKKIKFVILDKKEKIKLVIKTGNRFLVENKKREKFKNKTQRHPEDCEQFWKTAEFLSRAVHEEYPVSFVQQFPE